MMNIDPSVWAALGAIIIANLLLSGDNAVVIAMAARSLPEQQRRKAVFWGSAAAILLRVVLTLAAVQLLQLPYLKMVGAVLLLWIGVQLLNDSGDSDEVKAQGTLAGAIRTILVADLVMSLDNVLAVAGAADRAPPAYQMTLVIIGLALSIPIIIAGSTLLLKVMDRMPFIITLGAALLGYLSGEMFISDPSVVNWFAVNLPHAGLIFGIGGAVLVVAIGKWLNSRNRGRVESAAG